MSEAAEAAHVPTSAKEWFKKAFDAHRRGDLPTAREFYGQSLMVDPMNHEAHNCMGVIAFQERRYDEALIHWQDARYLSPDWPVVNANIGAALINLNRPAEALGFCAHPYRNVDMFTEQGNLPSMSNLADALIRLGRHMEAKFILRAALDQDPDFPETLVNLGIVETCLGNIGEASILFERAANPADTSHVATRMVALAKKNLGVMHLSNFNFAEGWEHYQARWAADAGVPHRYLGHPEWDGTPQPDGHLIVVAEQGLGDELLYLNMADDIADRFAGKVSWEADVRLFPILSQSIHDHRTTFVSRMLMNQHKFPGATHRIDAGTLGKFLRPSIESFPHEWLAAVNPGGYLYPGIYTEPKPGVLKIGVSWRSINTIHGQNKSVPLSEWAGALDMLALDGKAQIYNLQYGSSAADTAENMWIRQLSFDARYEIASLARFICSCSHVITVSNTTAHLAGALGVPTYVLVPDGMARYWYWGQGASTPWYRSAKIMRQNGRPWSDVLEDIALDILRTSAQPVSVSP